MLRALRKGILLYILILVAVGDWLLQQRLTSWDNTLWVGVYPINGDGSAVSDRYIADLDSESLEVLSDYFKTQGRRFRIAQNEPVKFFLLSKLSEAPPLPPSGGNMFEVMWWSLNLRWWAWQVEGENDVPIDVQIFVRYFDPEKYSVLQHSLGLQKGRIGIVNAFASGRYQGSNQVVIAHELLHTVGATDKYDLTNNLPLYPDGFAEPQKSPRYPQQYAELMGGRIPVSATDAEVPRRLSKTLIGSSTAKEIGWQ